MKPSVVATLNTEDRARYRQLAVREQGYRINAAAYSRDEIEQNEMALFRIREEFIERYELDDTRDWKISISSGLIIYGTWAED